MFFVLAYVHFLLFSIQRIYETSPSFCPSPYFVPLPTRSIPRPFLFISLFVSFVKETICDGIRFTLASFLYILVNKPAGYLVKVYTSFAAFLSSFSLPPPPRYQLDVSFEELTFLSFFLFLSFFHSFAFQVLCARVMYKCIHVCYIFNRFCAQSLKDSEKNYLNDAIRRASRVSFD